MANSFKQQAQERAKKLFQKHFEMILDQFYWFDFTFDELSHSRLVWMGKLSAIHSVELQLELCDPLSDTYWQSVIREIYDINIPFNPNLIKQHNEN